MTVHEIIVFPIQEKFIYHNYSDANLFPHSSFKVYSLEETLSEKLRAISGQRKFAIARDLFDIFHIIKNGVDVQSVLINLPQKYSIKGILSTDFNLNHFLNRRGAFEANWRNNLEYLIPQNLRISFEEAWNLSLGLINRIFENRIQ